MQRILYLVCALIATTDFAFADGHTALFVGSQLINPRLKFQNSAVVGTFNPATTQIPGYLNSSNWTVNQWQKDYLMRSNRFMQGVSEDKYTDSVLGTAEYVYGVPYNNSQLRIYPNIAKPKLRVYELWSRNGTHNSGGGTNVFISAPDVKTQAAIFMRTSLVKEPGLTPGQAVLNSNSEWSKSRRMDMTTYLGIDLKLKEAVGNYIGSADADNAAHAQAFTGMTFHYIAPNGARKNLFLQIRHANLDGESGVSFQWMKNDKGEISSALWGGVLEPYNFLTDATPNEPIKRYTFNLNKYLCSAINSIISSKSALKGNDPFIVSTNQEIKDLKNWELRSFFTGVETFNNYDVDTVVNGHHYPAYQSNGTVALRLQISDIQVNRAKTTKSVFANCP